jgi:type IV secretion system protein VirB6
MAALTYAGTGRQVGEVINEGVASRFRSVALADETAFGWSRPIFLASTIGAFGVLRIGGGLLLALAPLLAGLLLFDFSRGLFVGWLRGLVFVALGSLGVTVVLAVQLAVMEPWMAEALNRRNLGYATPTVPTELFALTLAFAAALIGTLFLLARVAFQNSWVLHVPVLRSQPQARGQTPSHIRSAATEIPAHPRAIAISESVTTLMRREQARAGGGEFVRRIEAIGPAQATSTESGPRSAPSEPLGSGHRRTSPRETRSGRDRNERR